MRKFLRNCLWTIAALVPAASPAGAAIVYSTFGPSQSFDTGQYVFVRGAGGVPATVYQAYASAFTATDDYTVTRIDVALALNGVRTPDLLASFWTGAASLPETRIGGSFAIDALSKFFAVSSAEVVGVDLLAGRSYFLVLQPAEASSDTIWFLNSIGALAKAAIDDSSGFSAIAGLRPAPAFDVIGTAITVAEPDSMALLAFGIASLIGAQRRQGGRSATLRRYRRIFREAASAATRPLCRLTR